MVYTLWNLVSELPVIWYWHFNIWNTWYVRCGTHVIIKTTTTVCLIFLMYAFLVCAWKRTSGIFKRPASTLVHKWCSSSEAVCTETSLRTVPVQEEGSLFVNQSLYVGGPGVPSILGLSRGCSFLFTACYCYLPEPCLWLPTNLQSEWRFLSPALANPIFMSS